MKKQELNITIDPQCPDEIKANGIAWVEDACNWLLSQPRTTDAIQPRFSEVAITIKPCGFGRGVRDVRDGRGSLALDTGTDLKIDTGGKIVVIPTAQEIAFRGNAVFLLSQLFRPEGYYEDSFRQEEHTHYQLKFLDRLAESNRTARSVVDDFEQIQADKIEQEKEEAYKQQLAEKRYLTARKHAYDTARRCPEWYYLKYKDSPQCQGDFLITRGGYVVAKHEGGVAEDLQQSGQAAPQPNLAVKQIQGEQPPLPMPQAPPPMEPMATIATDDEEAEIASWQSLYDAALGKPTASKEQCS